MVTAQQEEAMRRGLLDPETDQLTPKGRFVLKTENHPRKDMLRENFDKGLIDENAQFTPDGRVYFGPEDERRKAINRGEDPASWDWRRKAAVREGVDAWKAWHRTGAEDNWKEEMGKSGDSSLPQFLGEVGKAAKQLATKTVPAAAKGAAVIVNDSALGRFMSAIPGTPQNVLKKTKEAVTAGRPEWEKAVEEKQDAFEKLVLAEFGREAMRNQVFIDRGRAMVGSLMDPTKDYDDYLEKQWEFEKAQLDLDDVDSAQAAAAASSLLGGNTEKVLEQVGEAQEVASPELQQTAKEIGGAAGQIFGDPSVPLTAAASMGLRVGGMSTARALRLGQELAEKQARRARLASMGSMGRLPATERAIKALDDEIAGIGTTLARMENRVGAVTAAKDLVRAGSQRLAGSGLGQGVARVGQKLDNLAQGISKKASDMMGATGAIGVYGLLAGSPAGLAVATAGGLATQTNRIKTLLKGAQVMGSEFLRRRGTLPYFQRLANRAGDNKFLRGAALTADTVSRPIQATGRMGAAAGRAMAAEAPLSFIASGGQDGWLAEAMAEALVFGVPGEVKGLVHSMGGLPAVARKQECDVMALQDSIELKRTLPPEQQARFDELDPRVRRTLGVHSAVHPDITYRIEPGSGGGSYNSDTGVITIDPLSKTPLEVLISHEVLHHAHEQGLMPSIMDSLIGTEENPGFLYKPDGELTPAAKEFKAEYEKRSEAAILRDFEKAGLEVDESVRDRAKELAEMTPEELASEYYAVSASEGLTNSLHDTRLQRAARRNVVARKAVDAVLNRSEMLGNVYMRLGGMFNSRGDSVWGNGMNTRAKLPAELQKLTDRYFNEAAGKPGSQKSREARSDRAKRNNVDWQKPENYDLIQDNAMFEQDEKGKVKTDESGIPEPISWEKKKGREQSGKHVQEVLDELGIETFSVGNQGGYFTPDAENIPRIVEKLKEKKFLNDNQLQTVEAALNDIASDDPMMSLINYNAALKTNKRGKKAYSSKIGPEDRPIGFYAARITNAGNITFFGYDPRQLKWNVEAALRTKEAIRLYQSDMQAIMRDLDRMMENWQKMAKGEVPETFNRDQLIEENGSKVGQEKLKFLNAMFGDVGSGQKELNPLLQRRPFKLGNNAALFSPRLDRINTWRPLSEPMNFVQKRAAMMQLPDPVR